MQLDLRQRKFAWIAIVITTCIVSFPPWQYTFQTGSAKLERPAGYSFLLADSPKPTDEELEDMAAPSYGVSIDIKRLWLELFVVVLLSFGAIFIPIKIPFDKLFAQLTNNSVDKPGAVNNTDIIHTRFGQILVGFFVLMIALAMLVSCIQALKNQNRHLTFMNVPLQMTRGLPAGQKA